MSYYVWGSGRSYLDFLQDKSFSDDVKHATSEAGQRVSMELSRQTREIIASNEALARQNIRVMEASSEQISQGLSDIESTFNTGFERLSYNMQDISTGIAELNSTFHWGFSHLIAGIGHMNDALDELIKIAKTPVQTVAFNHFEIARDAFRQGLLQESLEELQKATNGDHTSPGYKLEWRFHQMVGTIRLGSATYFERSLIDLAKAEESFLLAARYAKTDYPKEAALAFLAAGWTAYCQGKMPEALTHTEQSLALNPKLGEALFQAAKINMAIGKVDKSLPVLANAIDLDRFYALKAADDGDFKKYEQKLQNFLEHLRSEKYSAIAKKAQDSLKKADSWLSRNLSDDQTISCIVTLREFWENKSVPLIDLLESTKDLHEKITELNNLNSKWESLKGIHQEVKEQAKVALKQINSLKQRFPEFDLQNTAKRIEPFVKEKSNWPLLLMNNELKSRKELIASTLEESQKKIINTLNDTLRKKQNALQKDIESIRDNYDKQIRQQYELERQSENNLTRAKNKSGCGIFLISILGSVLVLAIVYNSTQLSEKESFAYFVVFWGSVFLLYMAIRYLPEMFAESSKESAKSRIKELGEKRDQEIEKARKKFNESSEVIKLNQKLKSIKSLDTAESIEIPTSEEDEEEEEEEEEEQEEEELDFCYHCGAALSKKAKKCPECGKSL